MSAGLLPRRAKVSARICLCLKQECPSVQTIALPLRNPFRYPVCLTFCFDPTNGWHNFFCSNLYIHVESFRVHEK